MVSNRHITEASAPLFTDTKYLYQHYEPFDTLGVRVFNTGKGVFTERSKSMMHHKFVLADDIVDGPMLTTRAPPIGRPIPKGAGKAPVVSLDFPACGRGISDISKTSSSSVWARRWATCRGGRCHRTIGASPPEGAFPPERSF